MPIINWAARAALAAASGPRVLVTVLADGAVSPAARTTAAQVAAQRRQTRQHHRRLSTRHGAGHRI